MTGKPSEVKGRRSSEGRSSLADIKDEDMKNIADVLHHPENYPVETCERVYEFLTRFEELSASLKEMK